MARAPARSRPRPSTESRDLVEVVEEADRQLTDTARRLLGVSGRHEYGRLRAVLAASGLGWFPAVALGLVAAVDAAQLVAIPLLLPEIERTWGPAGFDMFPQLRVLAFAVGALLILRVLPRRGLRPHRGAVLAMATFVIGLTLGMGTVAASALGFVASGVVHALLGPMLFDHYRPEVRVRLFAVVGAGAMVGAGATGALVALSQDAVDLSWRGVLLILGAGGVVAGFVVLWLRDSAASRWDLRPLSRRVYDHVGASFRREVVDTDESDISTTEQLRRVTSIPVARSLILTAAITGYFLVPFRDYLQVFLRDHWGMNAEERLWTYSVLCLYAVPGLVWFGRRGEVRFRSSPAELFGLMAKTAATAATALLLAMVVPSHAIVLGLLALVFGVWSTLLPGAGVLLLSVVHPRLRAHAAALLGLALVAGVDLGRMVQSTFGGRFGVAWGIRVGALVLGMLALSLRRASTQVDRVVDRLATSLVDEQSAQATVSLGGQAALLDCRHIDFFYGQLQVLFDVNYSVQEGEMVALLGTNGAGKSTLLRVISGLGRPSNGTVRHRGADITYLAANERVKLGIGQLPGGRAVFGPMTVVENLRAYGYMHGRDSAQIDRGIEATFDAFPMLAERRNQLAATLSGGEQQMLGLGAVLVRRPRLLLIDELSLGLAPIVVAELLEMVRHINQDGTAVVLVEQSVNVALSLASHAYFMEKGQIRFDGPSVELLERGDLLRSVFLKGVAAATGERA